jgi:hypothetical protein
VVAVIRPDGVEARRSAVQIGEDGCLRSARDYGVRSLKLAEQRGRKLSRAGSVGSGLAAATSRDSAPPDAGERALVEVDHRRRTPSGRLRHPAREAAAVR